MQVERMRAFIIRVVYYCILIGLVFMLFKYIMPMLMPFLLGFLIAFLLQPLIGRILKKTKLPRTPVAILLLITFYIVGAALITILGTQLVLLLRDTFYNLPTLYASVLEPSLIQFQNALEGLLLSFSPSLVDMFSGFGDSLAATLGSLVKTVSETVFSWAGGFATSVPAAFVKAIITLVVSFFCVVDYYTITGFLSRQLPQTWREMLFKIKQKGFDVICQFGKAYALLMSITFAELCIGLSLLRIENAFLVALCVAVVDILPVLGTGTVLIPWGLIMLLTGNVPMAAGLFILYAVIAVVRQMLEPRIVGKQIGLYPLITLVCMFVGTYLFGALGLFGLPIVATILLQLNRSEELHWFH